MTPADPAVADGVESIFREALSTQVPSHETDLIATGRLDSLALVELLFEIEQRFGVEMAVDALDIEQFRSLERIAAFVSQRVGIGRPEAA